MPSTSLTAPRFPRWQVGTALAYSLAVNFLSMFPETMCLRVAGGAGCDEEQQQQRGATQAAPPPAPNLAEPVHQPVNSTFAVANATHGL